jgi:hypothetical protein
MSDDYTGHLLEQILDEIKAVHEVVAGQLTCVEFNELRQDVAELKQDMKAVKAAVKDASEWQAEHDRLHSGAGPSGSNGRVPWLRNA